MLSPPLHIPDSNWNKRFNQHRNQYKQFLGKCHYYDYDVYWGRVAQPADLKETRWQNDQESLLVQLVRIL